jgi:integrase
MRKPNAAYRSREHLTEREVESLVEAAKDNRWGHRDSTMVLLAFRHGLRASELVDLRWEQVDLENGILHVRRVKQGTPATHPLTGRELRALRRLQRERESKSPFVRERTRCTILATGLCGNGRTGGSDCWLRDDNSPTHASA